ncbi:hypothetical protein [Breoghania sp.]|uniref:hypothetical protein n=1 Tax=Breoghania sp. TaxID=2065378 RepID=UPI0026161839|nr:hypothetical protein [Breoghania sp.]MDJ0930640.1 hypothetical protein [Breoghania sp.]
MTLRWDISDIQIIGDHANQENYCRFHRDGDAVLAVLADGMGDMRPERSPPSSQSIRFWTLACKKGDPDPTASSPL